MFPQLAIIAVMFLSAVATVTGTSIEDISATQTDVAEIGDISSAVILYDKNILQLHISWSDKLPNDTSYNVIVSPLNLTECPEMPCSLYGISKPETYLIIPESPMSYMDVMECSYMFGCNYTLTVETSNAMVARSQLIEIPYCIQGACSCHHASYLPKVQIVANVPSNNSINFHWAIRLNDGDLVTPKMLSKIYLKISEQTNPSLSWGGKLIPIVEEFYPISNASYTSAKDTLQGHALIKLRQPLTPKAILNLHSYVIDDLRCAGPANLIKVQVPGYNELDARAVQMDNDINLRTGLIVIVALFLCAVVSAFVLYLWRQKREKAHLGIEMEAHYLTPFATVVNMMEDNINYVDKYVEEAQAKGLADVFEIPHYAIQMGPEIGEGAFGRVYKATAANLRRKRGSTVVAVKQLKKNPSSDEVEEFLSEIEMLKGVGNHNNIVCFLGCCTIRPPYLMLMEYVGRGDLLTYLRTVRFENSKFQPNDGNVATVAPKPTAPQQAVQYIELKISTQSVDSVAESETERRRPKPSFAETTYTLIDDEEYNEPFKYILDHKELHDFALQIATGMRFLEEQEITHRDLAARNVLIDDRKTLKISDFGLSRHGIYTNTKTRKLPLRWLSIEAIRDNIYSSKSDVWAYGVVLWEIGTLGASPYPTISNHEIIPYLLSGKRLEKPDICTDQVYTIMLECWNQDIDQRPTFEQLYKALSPKTAYVDINSLSDDYVFPPIKD